MDAYVCMFVYGCVCICMDIYICGCGYVYEYKLMYFYVDLSLHNTSLTSQLSTMCFGFLSRLYLLISSTPSLWLSTSEDVDDAAVTGELLLAANVLLWLLSMLPRQHI